VISKTGP